MRLLSVVNGANVPLKLRACIPRRATNLARECTFAFVSALVHFQITACAKHLAAYAASVASHSRVDDLVNLQIRIGHKGFVALRARKGAFESVHGLLVSLHGGQIDKSVVAVAACVRSLTGVNSLVSS